MPFVPAPGVARVELIYLSLQQRVENVFHVSVAPPGPLSEAQLDAVRNTFNTWYGTNLRAVVSSQAVLQQIEVRDMTTQDALAKIYPCTSNCAGGDAAGAVVPNNVTVAVKWGTGYAGRSRRGRTFHIAMNVNKIFGNQITAAYQTSLQTAYTALITACNAAGTPLVIYSRVGNHVPRTSALLTPVLSATVEINIDSMRRRLTGPGRGE